MRYTLLCAPVPSESVLVVRESSTSVNHVNDDYDKELKSLLRWQAVDGAISIFHKIEKLPDADAQRMQYQAVYTGGLFPLLWNNAAGWRQRRRIARNYLKCFFSGAMRA